MKYRNQQKSPCSQQLFVPCGTVVEQQIETLKTSGEQTFLYLISLTELLSGIYNNGFANGNKVLQ